MPQRTTTKQDVLKALATIDDPELHIPITDLGLIYAVAVRRGTVKITMTLTTIGCPLFDLIESTIKKTVSALAGVAQVTVELTFDPPWSIEKMSPHAKAELGID